MNSPSPCRRTLGPILAAALFSFLAACNGGHPAEARAPSPSPAIAEAGARTHAEPGSAHLETTLPTSTLPSGTLPSVLDPEPAEVGRREEERESDPSFGEPEPVLTEVDGVRLRRLVVSRDVIDREPTRAGLRFEPENAPLYAFLDAENRSDEDRTLVVTFEGPGGLVTGDVALDIPAKSPRYRTWARSSYVQRPGAWHAVVRTLEGDFVGDLGFEIGD